MEGRERREGGRYDKVIGKRVEIVMGRDKERWERMTDRGRKIEEERALEREEERDVGRGERETMALWVLLWFSRKLDIDNIRIGDCFGFPEN